MVSITIVSNDEDFTKECAENLVEYMIDSKEFGLKGFVDKVLINNKEVWKCGDKTLKDFLSENHIKIMEKRVNICNKVIKEISKHSRKFFLNQGGKGNIARFYLTDNKVFYEDEWKKASKEIKKGADWGELYKWVNHGGTISEMINYFANFIYDGKKIEIFSRYWGYDFDSLKKIHQKAKNLGLCENSNFVLHDYDKEKDIIFCENKIKGGEKT